MEDNIYSLDKIAPHSILHISHDSCLKETDYHSHNFFEIAYIAEGSYTHRINGQLQKVKRGNIIFLKIGDKHSYKAETEPCDVINILFYPDLYDDDPETLLNYSNKLNIRKIIQLSNKDIRQVESIIKNMKYEQEFKRKDSLEIMKHYLDILLLVITRSLNEAEPTKYSKIDLSPLLNYISKNIRTLKPSDVVKMSSYNSSYFSKLFKENVGVNLVDYINQKRIEIAINLIKETNESFESISNIVGFDNTNYFYKIFKRYTGSTPSQFRKNK